MNEEKKIKNSDENNNESDSEFSSENNNINKDEADSSFLLIQVRNQIQKNRKKIQN